MSISTRVAARYKSKKEVKNKDGETSVVYEYSDKHLSERAKGKAKKYESLAKDIEDLRKKVRSDMKSEDQKTRMTALAVALLDHTFERVGNSESADEGHYGVTGWTKSHISFSGKGATLKYVGKSGVDHEKKVTDPEITKALKSAYDGTEGKDGCIFEWDGGCVKAKDVNSYLSEYDVTAKDLRGFHANRLMSEKLKEIRKGKLPEDSKEREAQLKEEFKKALEETAEEIGHTPKMLADSYLNPGTEEAYKKDGTISKLAKSIVDRFTWLV